MSRTRRSVRVLASVGIAALLAAAPFGARGLAGEAAAPPAGGGQPLESGPPPETKPALTEVETRSAEIFPFALGGITHVYRVFDGGATGSWQIQTVTISTRTHPEARDRTIWMANLDVRNAGARQCFPRIRIMLYANGVYAASLYMPPRLDPYQEIEPKRSRRMTGMVALPLAVRPDAFRIDAVPEVLGMTSQDGLPADEVEKKGGKPWLMQIDRQFNAICQSRVPRGFLFQTEQGAQYLRLLTGETFVAATVPSARLDPKALQEAKERSRKH